MIRALLVLLVACAGAPRAGESDDAREGARTITLAGERQTVRGELDGARDQVDWIRVDGAAPPDHPRLVVEFRPTPGADLWVTLYGVDGSLSPSIKRESIADGAPATFSLEHAPPVVYLRVSSKAAAGRYELALAYAPASPVDPPDPANPPPERPTPAIVDGPDHPLPCTMTGDRPRFPDCTSKPAPPAAAAPVELRIVRSVPAGGSVKVTLDGGSRLGITASWSGQVLDDKKRPVRAFKLVRIDPDEVDGIVPITYDQMQTYRTARLTPP